MTGWCRGEDAIVATGGDVIGWKRMNDTRYIPIQGRGMKSFIFKA